MLVCWRVIRVPVDTSAVDTCVCYCLLSKHEHICTVPTSSKGFQYFSVMFIQCWIPATSLRTLTPDLVPQDTIYGDGTKDRKKPEGPESIRLPCIKWWRMDPTCIPQEFGKSILKLISWQATDAIDAWIHECPNAAANVENHCSHPSYILFPIRLHLPPAPDSPFLFSPQP